jgi:hypothetical protein
MILLPVHPPEIYSLFFDGRVRRLEKRLHILGITGIERGVIRVSCAEHRHELRIDTLMVANPIVGMVVQH